MFLSREDSSQTTLMSFRPRIPGPHGGTFLPLSTKDSHTYEARLRQQRGKGMYTRRTEVEDSPKKRSVKTEKRAGREQTGK